MSLPWRLSVVGSWIWKKSSSRFRNDVCSGSKMISIASACAVSLLSVTPVLTCVGVPAFRAEEANEPFERRLEHRPVRCVAEPERALARGAEGGARREPDALRQQQPPAEVERV